MPDRHCDVYGCDPAAYELGCRCWIGMGVPNSQVPTDECEVHGLATRRPVD